MTVLNDNMRPVQRLRFIPVIALVFPFLLMLPGCGQFFPSPTSITALQIAPSNFTVAPGATQQYTATATYGNHTTADVTSSVSWSTSQPGTATISSTGLLTGVALGTAIVKAQSGHVTASTNVMVSTQQVSSLSITPLTQTLSVSLGPPTVQFIAIATYTNGSMNNVTSVSTWTSTASSVVSISSTGLATAAMVGTANVTATSGGVTSNSATITVTP